MLQLHHRQGAHCLKNIKIYIKTLRHVSVLQLHHRQGAHCLKNIKIYIKTALTRFGVTVTPKHVGAVLM